jgi:asparaginyl-tRNA synthetase
MATLENIVQSKFEHLTYSEAIKILESSNHSFEYAFKFGQDLQSEHERYITETVLKRPVIIYDYPKTIKPFYMRLNDDLETVAAMDVLVPGIGEIIGGSQREERKKYFIRSNGGTKIYPRTNIGGICSPEIMAAYPTAVSAWDLNALLMLITGIRNIRDVILFPRTPKNIEF